MLIRVAGVDPALSHMGIAIGTLDAISKEIKITAMRTVITDRRVNKVVRQNSDDLRRAQQLHKAMQALAGCTVVFSEVPSGAQSARAALSFGVAVGILASCPVPLIQVQPFETKMATVGTKTASKEEMIEWAHETYPHLPWLRYERKTAKHEKGSLHDENEHMADACAVIHAGVQTDEFDRLMSMWKAAA